nr:gastrokine-1-like [Caretta caretta]
MDVDAAMNLYCLGLTLVLQESTGVFPSISAIIIGALLGVCLTQALADDSVNENNEGNNGGNSHQNVNVSNQDHTADINSYNGWKVWDAVWDYSKELFATRLFNKRAYIVAKMNKDAFPSLEKLSKFKDQKKYTISDVPLFDFKSGLQLLNKVLS